MNIKEILTRAVRTLAQSLLAFLGTNAIGVTDVDWLQALNVGAFAAILSILMSVAYPQAGPSGPPLPDEAPAEDALPEEGTLVDGRTTSLGGDQPDYKRKIRNAIRK